MTANLATKQAVAHNTQGSYYVEKQINKNSVFSFRKHLKKYNILVELARVLSHVHFLSRYNHP